MHGLLEEVGMRFSYNAEYHTLRDIKEKHAYVAQDFDQEMRGNFYYMKNIWKLIEMTASTSCLMDK